MEQFLWNFKGRKKGAAKVWGADERVKEGEKIGTKKATLRFNFGFRIINRTSTVVKKLDQT